MSPVKIDVDIHSQNQLSTSVYSKKSRTERLFKLFKNVKLKTNEHKICPNL